MKTIPLYVSLFLLGISISIVFKYNSNERTKAKVKNQCALTQDKSLEPTKSDDSMVLLNLKSTSGVLPCRDQTTAIIFENSKKYSKSLRTKALLLSQTVKDDMEKNKDR